MNDNETPLERPHWMTVAQQIVQDTYALLCDMHEGEIDHMPEVYNTKHDGTGDIGLLIGWGDSDFAYTIEDRDTLKIQEQVDGEWKEMAVQPVTDSPENEQDVMAFLSQATCVYFFTGAPLVFGGSCPCCEEGGCEEPDCC